MCGFIAHWENEVPNTHFVLRRGPHLTNSVTINGFTFIHYLLHITGLVTPQPFVNEDIVCLFNGEIYNHSFSCSDGEVIIPLYKKYGEHFAKHLDGEFAIAIYDFAKEQAIFCTDAFGTKPLWINGLTAASYGSCLGGTEVPPNTIIVRSFNLDTEIENIYEFDFRHQVKNNYDDWIMAFENAIAKRAYDNCFIGLSSGYDSGAIACELARQSVAFTAYSIAGSEDVALLKKRLEMVNGKLLYCDEIEYKKVKAYIKQYAEEYDYSSVHGGPIHCKDMTDDWGAVGSALLYREAKTDGRKVCLCGQGADEILSDYSLYPDVSTLHGVFPDTLHIWPNFFEGCQHAYLRKEENIAGCYGIEARYPFLDRNLVQEFLWLSPELKNRAYKAPIDYYLNKHGYPFLANKKIGFSAI